MMKIRCILFDCMETLVDLTELPALRDYARWAFDGSGVEHLWGGFETFFSSYEKALLSIREQLPQHKEYDMGERLARVVHISLPLLSSEDAASVSAALYSTYWKAYKSRCYVREDVRETLAALKEKYRLGVVSNFMVPEGIEELLEYNGILSDFAFVITSIREGWRKPHEAIYRAALSKSGIGPEETVFVGDDYVNDYVAPRELDFHTVLLDRSGRYGEIEDRIMDFYQLEGIMELLQKK